jgi:hypothetical protein
MASRSLGGIGTSLPDRVRRCVLCLRTDLPPAHGLPASARAQEETEKPLSTALFFYHHELTCRQSSERQGEYHRQRHQS